MADFKQKAQQHFLTRRDPSNLKSMIVQEWETTIYFYPSVTAEDRSAMYAAIGRNGVQDYQAGQVQMVIQRACDQHGRRLFAQAEFDELATKYDWAVINRIADFMADNSEQLSAEEAEKK